MTDQKIIELYISRSEEAVTETRRSFGALMESVARGILKDGRDAEEAVSDACMALWSSIPPNRPDDLAAYAAKLTRNAALDRLRHNTRQKRGGGGAETALDEIGELACPTRVADEAVERLALSEAMNRFLAELPKRKRTIFVKRYWYLLSAREIARELFMSEAAVKTELSRLRAKLREMLEREGLYHE